MTNNPNKPDDKRCVEHQELDFPDPIDDAPESVASALFAVNPNDDDFEWDYLQENNEDRNGEV